MSITVPAFPRVPSGCEQGQNHLCLYPLSFILYTLPYLLQGDSVARGPKLLSIKNYFIEIMTWKFIYTYRERCKKQDPLIPDAETGLLSHPSTLECVSPNSGLLFPKCRHWRLESLATESPCIFTFHFTDPHSRHAAALKSGRSRVRFPIVSLEFFIDVILPAALWSWDRLSL